MVVVVCGTRTPTPTRGTKKQQCVKPNKSQAGVWEMSMGAAGRRQCAGPKGGVGVKEHTHTKGSIERGLTRSCHRQNKTKVQLCSMSQTSPVPVLSKSAKCLEEEVGRKGGCRCAEREERDRWDRDVARHATSCRPGTAMHMPHRHNA